MGPEDLPSFCAKLLFHFFCTRKQTTFPPIVTVRQSALVLSCMRNDDYHGAIIERQTLHCGSHVRFLLPPPPSFMVAVYCKFSTPPSPSNSLDHNFTWPRTTLSATSSLDLEQLARPPISSAANSLQHSNDTARSVVSFLQFRTRRHWLILCHLHGSW